MLHDNMNIYRLMFDAQQMKRTRLRRMSKEAKMSKSYKVGSSKGRLDIQDKTRFTRSFPS